MTQKFIILCLLLVSISVTSPVPSRASDLDGQLKLKLGLERKELREEIKDNQQEARSTIKQEKQELKGTISQNRQEFRKSRLTAVYTAIKKNLESRFKFINETLKPKVQAKIELKTKEGKNTTEASAKFSEYSTSAYTTHMVSLESKYNELLNSTEPLKLLKQLNESAKLVRQDLNKMRQTLVESFRLAIRSK